MNSLNRACYLTKQAINDTITELDMLLSDSYSGITLLFGPLQHTLSVLNLSSTSLYPIMNSLNHVYYLTKQAIDNAIAELHTLLDDSHSGITLLFEPQICRTQVRTIHRIMCNALMCLIDMISDRSAVRMTCKC